MKYEAEFEIYDDEGYDIEVGGEFVSCPSDHHPVEVCFELLNCQEYPDKIIGGDDDDDDIFDEYVNNSHCPPKQKCVRGICIEY